MRRREALAALLVAAPIILGLWGCSKKLNPIGNAPPETYVFVQGPVDTVSHRVHLYWYGTDPDGDVVAYAVRWVYPAPAPQDVPWDTLRTAGDPSPRDSMFTMPTGDDAVVVPRFEVYAIDDLGAADPSPAVQTFLLSNLAPVVTITDPLGSRDTTYASVTFRWETNDPDGGGPGLRYRIWLDGNEATPDSTEQRTFTVPSARFLQGTPPTYRSGLRTVFLQAVDDGGRRGPVVSFTWFVRAPAAVMDGNQARLLVIDDVPQASGNNAFFDTWYLGGTLGVRYFGISDWLPAGTYEVVRPEIRANLFRSAMDVAQTFRQYKAVLWYRGDNLTVSPWLALYEDGLGEYLDQGGNLYLDGVYLIRGLNTPGSLSEEFVGERLGSDGLYNCFSSIAGVMDSTAGWGSRNGTTFRSSVYAQSFRGTFAAPNISGSSGGLRGFVVRDTSNVALWAMDGQLTPANVGFEVPVAVTVPQPAGGRMVLSTFPLPYGARPGSTDLIRRVLNSFGIGVALP